MKNILIILFLLFVKTTFSQTIDSVKVNYSLVPATVKTKGLMPNFTLSKINIISLNDIYNTQVINIYFKGCPINQITLPYDTTINISAPFPFALQIYTFHDTSINCSYPTSTLLIDSLHLSSSQILSVDNNSLLNSEVNIYPNPTSETLNIDTKNLKLLNIFLYDIKGSLIKHFEKNNNNISINNVSKGSYILKIETDKGIVAKKILIE